MAFLKLVILTIIAGCACNLVFGQSSQPGIFGKVVSIDKKPLEGATVALINANDTIVIKSVLTQADGRYSFSGVKAGNYRIRTSYVGYDPNTTAKIDFTKSTSLTLEAIVLSEKNSNLKEVSVTAQKPFVENQVDRTVVNVGALISNTGANVLEVLQKSPGVMVDESGNITFKGKSGVLVMIDDKPTFLSASNLASYLRSLPASSIEKIELMDNPPAKYDAAGSAGVINIRTKKSTTRGLNGTVSANVGQAVYPQHSENLNLNYRYKKINVFFNGSYSWRKSYRRLEIDRNYLDQNSKPLAEFRQASYFKRTSDNISIKTGLDYYLSSKSTLGLVLTGSASPNTNISPVSSRFNNGRGIQDSTILALNESTNNFINQGVNVNFLHKYDSTGKQISADLDYLHYKSSSDQTFQNNSFLANGDPKLSETTTGDLPAVLHIYSAKSDFSKPLTNNGKFEAGVKSSLVNTDNAANYFNIINGLPVINYNNTNRFKYNENINAGYVNFNGNFKRLSVQTGLRVENTNNSGHQLGNAQKRDSSFSNHYTSLFPTAFLSYKTDSVGNNVFGLSYGRRINRPYYQDLNPFVFFIDKFTYFAGNPFVKSQISDNYKASYSYKSILTAAFILNLATNLQTETIEQTGDIFISRPGNIGKRVTAGLTLNLNLKPKPWCTTTIYTEFLNNKFRGRLYNIDIATSAPYWYFSANNQITLSKKLSAELSGFYITGRKSGQFINVQTWQLNAGLQQKIMKDKGSIRLNMRDILHSFSASGEIRNIGNATAFYRNYLDTQILTLGFSYNFGKSFKDDRKRNTGGAESEQNRVKN